jgi:hypothetical protein
MKRLQPTSLELGSTQPIRARAVEDLSIHVDFEESVIADIDFTLILEEFEWPYMPSSYSKIERQELTGFSEEEIDQKTYRVSLVIPVETVSEWQDRRFSAMLVGEKDGRTWTIVDTTIAVAKGS